MMWHLFLFLPSLLCTIAIKVPNNNNEEKAKPISPIEPEADYGTSIPINYQDEELVDSYLTTPKPSTEELLPPGLEAPATYLLPPSSDRADYYYATTEPSSQSDWYPIAQTRPNKLQYEQQQESIPVYESDNQSAVTKKVRKPSQRLEAPFETPDFAIVAPSQQQQLPVEGIKKTFSVPIPIYPLRLAKANRNLNPPIYTEVVPSHLKFTLVDPTIALHLTPPKPPLVKYKNPTKLYPKKYSGGFKPIPIPIAQFADEQVEVPTAKPLKVFMPAESSESEYLLPIDQKKLYNYQQLEQKRKLKENDEAQQVSVPASVEKTYAGSTSEQQTLETNQRYPRVYSNVENVYSAPLQEAPSVAPQSDALAAAPPSGERTEFRMHGMKGPHSYQFGYDTGKGKNRQFRYEERDNDGHVRGHYGYMDKRGKLRVVNYDAHPEHGFHAEAPVEKDDH